MNLKKIALYSSISFVALLLFVSIFVPWLAPYSYEVQNVQNAYSSPSGAHLFGTDALGRDLLSRLLYGCRVSMSIAIMTAVTSVLVGVIYGTIAGYVGGWLDMAMMRFVDIFNTLPSFIIMILLMMVLGRGLLGIFVALTITGWLGTARIMRAQVISCKQRPFIEAARSLGVSPLRLICMHILPNTIAPIIVELSYQIPTNVLSEAFLSFLGIGVRPPTPSWGVLSEEGWRALQAYPHLTLFPGLCIFLSMLAFNTIGDDLRDRLDPFLKGRT